jgi:hypothetical protein
MVKEKRKADILIQKAVQEMLKKDGVAIRIKI